MPSSTSVAAWSSSRLKGPQLYLVGSLIRRISCPCPAGCSRGSKPFSGTAENDSLLKIFAEVRDLIAGQGWFDLHQYRMGTGGGLLMHWSRLVDAPIAAIMLAVTTVTGSQATGEIAALIAWPFALYTLALYLLLRIGYLLAGEEPMFPLLIIGGATLYYTGIFAVGAIDHHNIQLVLMLAMVLFLLQAGRDNSSAGRSAWLAGISAVLMLAIGMETVPYIAVGGLFVAVWFLVRGDEARGARRQVSAPHSRRHRVWSSSPRSRGPNGAPPIATHIRSLSSRSAPSRAPALRRSRRCAC